MTEPRAVDRLIHDLSGELRPVRRLPPPWRRALGWLLLVAMLALGLLACYGVTPMLQRWSVVHELRWATLGAGLTMITAAWVAFVLAVPGRRVAWAWLPLPPLLLWIGASGLGCLQPWIAPGMQQDSSHAAPDCLVFILAFSVPLSSVLILLLRRACPLRPSLTAVMIGLASAAASASLLEICHAFEATAADLLTHALAVGLVVAGNAALGGRLLMRSVDNRGQ